LKIVISNDALYFQNKNKKPPRGGFHFDLDFVFHFIVMDVNRLIHNYYEFFI